MNNLLDNQKIQKRRYFSPAISSASSGRDGGRPLHRNSHRNRSGKPAFRPAGISSLFQQNTKIINELTQKPARIKRENHSSQRPITEQPKNRRPESRRLEGQRQYSGRKVSSLALPAIPVFALGLLTLGILFVAQNQGGLGWISRKVVNFEDSQVSQYNLALYAGVIPHTRPGLGSPENAETAESAEIAGFLGNTEETQAIPLDLTETFAWHSYRVQRGDSVSKIASNFAVSMDAIIASNSITNVRSLREGEVLRIPNMDGIPYIVKQGDSLSKISQSMGVPLEAILDANDLQSDIINAGMNLFIPGARMNREDLRLALGELFVYPVRGARLSSGFGWRNDPFTGVRRHHAAIDLSTSLGTPVIAAMEGRVSFVGYDNTYGNFIILSHPGGYQTMYAHLHTVIVSGGNQVQQGERIGTVGNTGYSTGPHLHFAIYRNSRAVNPLDFLRAQR